MELGCCHRLFVADVCGVLYLSAYRVVRLLAYIANEYFSQCVVCILDQQHQLNYYAAVENIEFGTCMVKQQQWITKKKHRRMIKPTKRKIWKMCAGERERKRKRQRTEPR